MPLINGIHHVGIKCDGVEEFEKAVRFYQDVLGFGFVRSWGEGTDATIMLRCGDSMFEFCASGKTSRETGSVNHIALAVDDVDACVEAVKLAGCPITLGPVDVPVQAQEPYPVRVAFCIGPVGEEIEFFKEY